MYWDGIIASNGNDGEKIYTLRDLFWIIPVIILSASFIGFTVWFYWMFPIQLIWVVLYLPLGLIISLTKTK